MGFSEGLEDDFLLTCFVCKSPFGMLASFCGECGCRRDQALGVERASTQQQIVNNNLTAPSYYEQAPDANVIPEYQEIFANPGTTPPPPVRQKSIKSQIRKQNFYIRLEKINNFQSTHAIKLNLIGSLMFIASVYVLFQGYIFASASPKAEAENYLKLAVTRDAGYFANSQSIKFYPGFPARFSPWDGQFTPNYIVESKSKVWAGDATVEILPSSQNVEDIRISLQLKAEYKATLGIFREIDWKVDGQAAIFTLSYPTSGNYSIYINGLAAGTTKNPAVAAGTYYMYPGELEIKFFGNGSETEYEFSGVIGTSGIYSN